MRRAAALAAAGLLLQGCALEPRYVRPAPAVPQTWPMGAAYPAPSAEAALPSLSYREVFRDPRLQQLVDRALAGNQDLRAALANVEIARAQYRIQRADLLPQIGANGAATEIQGRDIPGEGRNTSRNFSAGLQLSRFEIDLFGLQRSLSRAAFDAYLATDAGARSARLSLVGQVAFAYLTLAADRSLLAVSTDTVASATRTVALNEARLVGGVASRTEVAQARTLLAQARSDQQQRITRSAQDRNALELLVGAPIPDDLLPESLESVDGLLAEAPAGLDSRILLRRPDVMQAEYRLRAANARIGAARAAFFPSISLTGVAGYASPALGALFEGRNSTWQAQGAASQPIFTGGAAIAGLGGARAQREQAVASYQAAIQAAFRDVADALARRGTIDPQLAAQNDLVAAATTSYTLQTARYREGVTPFLNVLDAQRTLYSARQSLTATRLARAANLVDLYQALGADPLLEAMPIKGGPIKGGPRRP
jgi:multidrug efflux system outer membrane protein